MRCEAENAKKKLSKFFNSPMFVNSFPPNYPTEYVANVTVVEMAHP